MLATAILDRLLHPAHVSSASKVARTGFGTSRPRSGRPVNREIFELYVEKILVPELQPGDVVVMD